MNLKQALRQIPWKHRGKILKICRLISDNLADQIIDQLDKKQLEKLKTIGRFNNSAKMNYTLEVCPNIEEKFTTELLKYFEDNYGLK